MRNLACSVLMFGLTLTSPAWAQICAPPPAGIVAWWPADGNANDIVGANNGTLQRAVGFAPGEVGQAFNFTGNGQVAVGVPNFATPNSGFTVEAWVKPSALGACTALACTSIVHRELNASSRTWWLGIDGSSIRFLLFLTQPSGGRVDVFSPGEVVPGVFQHIAASYDGIAVRLYHNGTLVWTQVVGPANFNNGDPVNIGIEDLTSSGSYLPFNGSIDELSIYNRALSGLEIAAIVGAGTAGKCRPLRVRAVYVTNSGSATVSVIDPATNAVVATVPVGRNPVDVAVTPNGVSAYVTNAGASSVSVINTATNTVIATVPVGHNPANVAITPDGGAAYVANAGSSSVSVINTATNTVVATVPVGLNPAKVAITPNGSTAYVANAGSSSVSVINTATHAVTATVPVGLNPVGIAIH